MATQCNQPFQLTLYRGEGGLKKEEAIRLTPNLEEIVADTESYRICITENTTYELGFQADNYSTKLYIEGLEQVANSHYDEKREQYYIYPQAKPFVWFRWDISNKGLVPGSYYIKVQDQDQMYYGVLKVEPKHLEDNQLEQMKDEVEAFLQKWKDLPMGIRESIEEKVAHDVTSDEERQIKVLMKWHSQLVPLLHQLKTQLDEQIEKIYSNTPKELGRKIDHQAIKMSLRKNTQVDSHFTYIKQTTYDTKENKWIKNFNEKLIGLVMKLEKGKCTSEARNVLARIHSVCQNLRQSIGYQAIKNEGEMMLPLRCRYDSRYRMLDECHNELWKSTALSNLKAIKDYLWLETSWVYEIWCFKQVYEQLKESGYTQIGHMPSGFILQKEEVTLKLHYDQLIPINSVQTSRKQPLYARSPRHRRPDGRIDFYKKDRYCGSVVLEFKYSKSYHVWNEMRDTRCSEQLLHYGYQLGSLYLEDEQYQQLPKKIREQINPIHKVIAIMPKLRGKSYLEEDHETNIVQVGMMIGDSQIEWEKQFLYSF